MRSRQRFFLTIFICISCLGASRQLTVRNSILVPRAYVREAYSSGSYSDWIQNLPLKAQPTILDYKGRPVESGLYRVFGVVDMPLLFQSDLEQCADFAMRFWAEYHKSAGTLDTFYLFDYGGQKKPFAKSGKSYAAFLKWSFANTNSHSLKSGCRKVASDQLIPGDMFVQNRRGGIGHVSVVLDVCRSKEGKKLYLIGYSFMPAQQFHIEKAADQYGAEGWFTVDGYVRYLKDNLDLGKPELRRFDPQ
jgi:hypothetical protein